MQRGSPADVPRQSDGRTHQMVKNTPQINQMVGEQIMQNHISLSEAPLDMLLFEEEAEMEYSGDKILEDDALYAAKRTV